MNHFLRKRMTPNQCVLITDYYDSIIERELEMTSLVYFLMGLDIHNLEELANDMNDHGVDEERQIRLIGALHSLFCDEDDLSSMDGDVSDIIEYIIHETAYDSTHLINIAISDEQGYVHLVADESNSLLSSELQDWLKKILYTFPTWDDGAIFPIRCNIAQIDCDQWLRWINQTSEEDQYQVLTMLNQLDLGLDVFINNQCHVPHEINVHL